MGLKSGAGKCLVIGVSFIFCFGFYAAALSPNWVIFTFQDNTVDNGAEAQVRLGPFYGQARGCNEGGVGCVDWTTTAIDTSDCEKLYAGAGEATIEFCNKTNTWRIIAIICFIAVLASGVLIFIGCCCQALTCGCCGASLDFLAMLIYWAEVLMSIVCWSFAIVSVNIVNRASTAELTATGGYEWGFWLFIICGTILGAVCALLADCAAEDSCLKKIWGCIFCCCRKKDD